MEVVEVLISNDIELYLAVFKNYWEAFKLEWETYESIFVLSLSEIVDKLLEFVI